MGLTSFSKNKLNDIQLEKDGISISGGQKQKIELARALYSNKTLILADEITANLDKKNAEKIRTLLFNMDNPVVEVAHHFNIKDKRYTKIFILNNNGNLERVK
ncbi:ATP-binding cassette domain-containing protein [Lactobacillus sp. LL6]|uniref:ATP-binding cassette domain-containing protein n=1 Tax=Lactobacillus sp. LL6 TaxID=2596827 RepID=UPI002413080D|nr:ATP-binding cassette domain-containing protein [Lactobacillus sp. LL6]